MYLQITTVFMMIILYKRKLSKKNQIKNKFIEININFCVSHWHRKEILCGLRYDHLAVFSIAKCKDEVDLIYHI